MMRIESSWSVLPQAPNIIVPRQSFETWTPVRPRGRYSMEVLSFRSEVGWLPRGVGRFEVRGLRKTLTEVPVGPLRVDAAQALMRAGEAKRSSTNASGR